MSAENHPHWQCPRCGIVICWFGATSHMNRCQAKQWVAEWEQSQETQ